MYSFKASYGGDSSYSPSVGPCEQFTVLRAASSTVTAIGCCGTTVESVAAGTTVNDQATVTGGVGGFAASGWVEFDFFRNGTCGGVPSLTRRGPVANWTASSGPVGPLGVGSYSFRASYGGDANYAGSLSTCESLNVTVLAASSIATGMTSSGPSGPVTVTSVAAGSAVVDHATVSGGGPAPTGTVSFRLYATGDCSGPGSPAGTSPVAVASSDAQGPLTAGSYSFQASYSGDAYYAGSTSACEPLSVTSAVPSSIATTIRVRKNGKVLDRATVSSLGLDGAEPTGTVSFSFYTTRDCSGPAVSAGTAPLSKNGKARSKAEKPPAGGSYSFQATYSGDTTYTPATSSCETAP